MDTPVGSVRCPLVIGRDELLELADRRLDDALGGRGQFLLVAGVAGIGKSRYLDAVVQKAGDRGFASAWGYVAPQDRDVPAASILDLARSMLRMPAFADLGHDLLALRDATIDAEHVRRRQLVMDVVDRMLAGVSGPTVLGFEDLQWADDLSLEIIAELARHSRDRQVLLCGGYRTDEAPPGTSLRDWRSRWITQRIAEEIRLTPLSQAETALVTTLILDTGLPAPREVAAAVYERTDGIPLHIEELLGALSAEARANGLAIREATVPETIEDAVLTRLSHRSREAQAVAKAGAIIGRCFNAEVLAGIMDVPQDAIDAPLQELIDNFVLEPPGPRGVFDFRHQLLRDAIYRSVPVGERRRFHARAGEFGAQLEGQSEIHSSLHYERAGMRDAAYVSALAGARDAERLSAHREAFELYRRATDHAPLDQTSLERGALFEAYANQAAALERIDVAISAATEAAVSYHAAGRPALALWVLEIVASMWRRQGHPTSERLASIESARAEVGRLDPSNEVHRVRAAIEVRRAITALDAFDLATARSAVAEAAESAAAVGDRELILVAQALAGAISIHDGEIDTGLLAIERTAHAQQEIGSDDALGSYRDGSELAVQHFRYDVAKRLISAGTRYAELVEQRHCAHVMAGIDAFTDWALGNWDLAVAGAAQAIADDGCERARAIARWPLGLVALGRGEQHRARIELEAAVDYAERGEVTDMWMTPVWALAEADLLAGRPAEAMRRVEAAAARVAGTGPPVLLAPFVVTGVRAAQAAGRPAAAAAWLEGVAAELANMPGVVDAALEHGRGLVALADGATGVARAALEAAVAGWDAKGRIWEATWVRLDLAQCLIRSNRFAEALSIAVEARTVASRLDSRPIADRADALQRMARGRVAVDEPWRPLTSREFAVARLISEGMTNAEIADSLGIAPKTASSHVEHILAKLGASRRAEVATWATNVDRSPAPH